MLLMHTFGFFGEVVLFVLAGLSMFGWMYLWYLCVFGAEKVLARIFGDHALSISAVGFPFVACFVLALALKIFGRDNFGWALLLFGIALPFLGILYLRNESRGKRP
jgi:hypothetical protein